MLGKKFHPALHVVGSIAVAAAHDAAFKWMDAKHRQAFSYMSEAFNSKFAVKPGHPAIDRNFQL